MDARESEARLLERCCVVAQDGAQDAVDACEANVFRLAAMLTRPRLPVSAGNLLRASERYFAQHPATRCLPDEIVRRGWVVSLPRLRDGMEAHLAGRASHA